MDFLIAYEHKARELEGIVLLKVLLERKGYSVMFYPWYDESKELKQRIRKDPPKVFVISATYNEENFRHFCTRVVGYLPKVINLRWEQVFTSEIEQLPIDFDKPAFYPSGIVRDVVHVCWGKAEQRQLIMRGVKEEKACVVGHIGMDFLRPEFSDLMYSKRELSRIFNINENKRWCLFISSFTVFEDDERTRKESNETTGGLKGDEIFIDACIKTRKVILEWFDRVLELYEDIIIIYRPHPNEGKLPSSLDYLCNKHKNFVVIPDLSVKQWINVSDLVYNWLSSSFADIAFLGKKSILLRPYYISSEYDYKALAVQPQISTYNDFKRSLDESLFSDSENDQEYNSVIHEYYDNDMYGEPAYSKAVELFEKVYKSSELDIHYSIRFILETKIFSFTKRIVSFFCFIIINAPILRKTIFKKKYKDNIENNKYAKERLEKGFVRNVATQKEIDEMIKKLKKILFNE